MPTYANKGEFLLVEVREPFKFEEFRSMIHEVAKQCAEQRLNKVILDMREAEGDLSTIERYLLGTEISRVWKHTIQGAGIAKRETINFMMENVAVNRGANVKAYFKMKDALGWLGVGSMGARPGG